jgi:hypothetical protein
VRPSFGVRRINPKRQRDDPVSSLPAASLVRWPLEALPRPGSAVAEAAEVERRAVIGRDLVARSLAYKNGPGIFDSMMEKTCGSRSARD